MSLLVLVVGVLFSVLLATILFLRKVIRPNEPELTGPWPYYAKKILTQTEIGFFWRLVEAMPECVVLARVPLDQLIEIKGPLYRRERRWWSKKISRKSVDFVICRNTDFSIVAAIDIDDRPQLHSGRPQGDRTTRRALAAAGVPLIRWNSEDMPDVVTLRTALVSGNQKTL